MNIMKHLKTFIQFVEDVDETDKDEEKKKKKRKDQVEPQDITNLEIDLKKHIATFGSKDKLRGSALDTRNALETKLSSQDTDRMHQFGGRSVRYMKKRR